MKATITLILLITGTMIYAQVPESIYEFRATHINSPSEQNEDIWGEWEPTTSDITFTWDKDAKVATIHAYNLATNEETNKKYMLKKLIEEDDCQQGFACYKVNAIDAEEYSTLIIQLSIPEKWSEETWAIASFTYDDYWNIGDEHAGTHAFALALVPKIN